MVFWKSWSNLYRFLFVLGCLFVVWVAISFLCRVIAARIQKRSEAGYQLETLDCPPDLPQIQRTHSVNFGVRALDSNETPAEAGIVDSESLRVFSPASRFSRVSSPASAGGRKDSDSTIGSVSETTGLVKGHRPQIHRIRRVSTPLSAPDQEFGVPGPSRSPRPITAHNTGKSSSTGSNLDPQEGHSEHLLVPRTLPYQQYLQVPPYHQRPSSTSSVNEPVSHASRSPNPAVKGILKNRAQVQIYPDTSRSGRAVTPGGTTGPQTQNVSTSITGINIAVPPTPASEIRSHPRARSAPPLKNHQSSNSSPYQPQSLTNIPEAFVEGPDGIELKERSRERSTENIPSLAGPSNAPFMVPPPSGFIIPHPTRAPPPIPFLSPSPAPTSSSSTPAPQDFNTKQNKAVVNKGKGRAIDNA